MRFRIVLFVLAALGLLGSNTGGRAQTPSPPANAVTQRVAQLLQAEKISEAEAEFTQYYSNLPDPERTQAIRASLQTIAGIVVNQLDKEGLALVSGHRLDDAKADFGKALRLREQIFGKESAGVAVSLNNIGLALFIQGKNEDAEPILRKAISLREKLEGLTNEGLVAPLTILGGVLATGKRFGEAETILQRALAINKSTGGSTRDQLMILRNPQDST